MALYPTQEQIQTLTRGPADQPVVMVNILTFKPTAEAPDEGVSGEEAYRRYAEKMRAFVESKGGRFIWIGRVDSQVIGTGGEGFLIAREYHRADQLIGLECCERRSQLAHQRRRQRLRRPYDRLSHACSVRPNATCQRCGRGTQRD